MQQEFILIYSSSKVDDHVDEAIITAVGIGSLTFVPPRNMIGYDSCGLPRAE